MRPCQERSPQRQGRLQIQGKLPLLQIHRTITLYAGDHIGTVLSCGRSEQGADALRGLARNEAQETHYPMVSRTTFMKYRLVKATKASGFVLWVIQKKWLWWWEYVDSYYDEPKARSTLAKLQSGVPEETRELVK